MPGFLASLAFLLGALLVFAGQRLLESGPASLALTAAGAVLALAAAGWRAARAVRAPAGSGARAVERSLLALTALGLLGLGLYFAQAGLAGSMPRLAGSLAALWPAVLAASLLPLLFGELAYASMARAEKVERGRVRDATLSGLGLAFAAVFAFAAMYVAGELNIKKDLSFFRPAKPGSATKRVIAGLDEPLEAFLFYPPGSDTGQVIEAYFEELRAESPGLKVERVDPALDPAKLRELKGTAGSVVIRRGERREMLNVPTELERARSQLLTFDQEIHRRLLSVAKGRRTVYLTQGHGERRESAEGARPGMSLFKRLLEGQSLDVRPLGIAEGLSGQVPADAAAVIVLGPQQPFLEPEVAALRSYLTDGKGRLLLALDPDSDTASLKPLLDDLGVEVSGPVLANDVVHARKAHQPSDRTLMGTVSYSSHPSVSAVGLEQAAMFFQTAGTATARPDRRAGLTTDTVVSSHLATWNDADGNFELNPPAEERRSRGLVVAVRRAVPGKPEDEMRALVASDSDFLGDEILQQIRGNVLFAVDAVRWLLGDESLVGATVNLEKDIPIVRTRKQDLVFFWGTTVLAPSLVLGVGLFASRRRRRGAGKKQEVRR